MYALPFVPCLLSPMMVLPAFYLTSFCYETIVHHSIQTHIWRTTQTSPLYQGPSKDRIDRTPNYQHAQSEKLWKSLQIFPTSAAKKTHLTCAICLNQHQHDVLNFNESLTWDQQHPTVSKCTENQNFLLKKGDISLCANYSFDTWASALSWLGLMTMSSSESYKNISRNIINFNLGGIRILQLEAVVMIVVVYGMG